MPRGNPQNLVSISARSTEEQHKIRSMGGKRSGEIRRAQRDWRNEARAFLQLALKDPESKDEETGKRVGPPKPISEMKSLDDIKKNNIEAGAGMIAALAKNALHGDRLAAETLFRLSGALVDGGSGTEQHHDDGFMEALQASAGNDWTADDPGDLIDEDSESTEDTEDQD